VLYELLEERGHSGETFALTDLRQLQKNSSVILGT
jgi:hypothetical protein